MEFYRVTDSDGDDELDHIETLHQFEGWGEHGPHSLILSPDGEQLYFIAGNHTDLPDTYHTLHPSVWDEDQLLPAIVDPRGHAKRSYGSRRLDCPHEPPTGSDFTIVSQGYRNAFDIAFNQQGDLFTFDADMGMGHGYALVSPGAHQSRNQRQCIRLENGCRQISGILPRQPAGCGRHWPGFPNRRALWGRLQVSHTLSNGSLCVRLELWHRVLCKSDE